MSGSASHVFCLGEAKCGTSSLFAHLRASEAVCPPLRKELHYFDRMCKASYNYAPRLRYRSIWYRFLRQPRCLLGCKHRLSLDATPAYFRTPGVEQLIKKHHPEAKLIVMMREPIARHYSNWWMLKRRDEMPDTFEAFVEKMLKTGAFHDGISFDYAENLARWLALFSREQLFVGFLEEMRDKPAGFFDDLEVFLGLNIARQINAQVIPDAPKGSSPEAHYPPLDASLKAELKQRYKTRNQALAQQLGRALPESFMV